MLNIVKKKAFFFKEEFLNFIRPIRQIEKQIKEQIENKYSDFFNSIKSNKGEYRINKDGSIDVICHNKCWHDFYFIETDVPPNTTFYKGFHYEIINFRKINKIKRSKNNVTLNDIKCTVCIICDDNVKNIGEGFSAGNLLILENKTFKKIPDNTKISNCIILYNSNVQEFGKNIKAKSLGIVEKEKKRKNYFIKNIENLELEELVIHDDIKLENINKIKNLKIVIGYPAIPKEIESMRNLSHDIIKLLDPNVRNQPYEIINTHKEVLDSYNKTDNFLKRENVCYNYLNFKSPNSFFSKLLNEEYDLITEEEIQKYFNDKEFSIYRNKVFVNVIDYCVSPKGIFYLKKLGYEFTERELNKITDPKIKSSYEKELINTITNKTSRFTKNHSYTI